MSTTYEVSFESLTLGSSNYDSWSTHVLNRIRTFGPHAEQVVVASILHPHTRVDNIDLSGLSIEELECWQLNSQVTNYIRSTLSCDVQELICDDIIDARDIWENFQDLFEVPKCEDQDQRASMLSEDTAATTHLHVLMMTSRPRVMRKEKSKAKMKIWGLSMKSRQLMRIKVQMCLQKSVLPQNHTLIL
jgi:hypothetical protein